MKTTGAETALTLGRILWAIRAALDTLALELLAALALAGVIVLAGLGIEVPGPLEYALAALVGAVTGSAFPSRSKGQYVRE